MHATFLLHYLSTKTTVELTTMYQIIGESSRALGIQMNEHQNCINKQQGKSKICEYASEVVLISDNTKEKTSKIYLFINCQI